MARRHGGEPRGRGRAALLVAAALAAAGCTFERRPDAGNGPEGSETPAETRAGTARDSVEATVDAFAHALQAGDISRAVGLLHDEATLHDTESGRRWEAGEPDSLLPGPVEREEGGLAWERADSRVGIFDAAALVVRGYRAEAFREEAPVTVTETWVLVRVDGGWRIRHLHRSRVPGPGS